MKISLIICAYNEENYIQACLESALKNSPGKFHEIIVVDNNSTDRTKDIAEKISGIRVVTELQKGPNHARQKGFEVATGDILAFIDADTRMPEGWIDVAINEFTNNPEMCCLSGPYFYYDFSKWQQFLSSIYWYVLAYPIYLLIGYMAIWGNFVIKKEVLEKMNGIDTSIPFYGDDTNIARRASKHGKVKFKLDFAMPSSARRLTKEGMIKTAFLYVINFFSQVLIKKTVTNSYKDIRGEVNTSIEFSAKISSEHFFKDNIYYRTNELKKGRITLVFIHGLTGSSSSWSSYEKIFENKYNLLTFDIRGHGKSKKFPHCSDYEIKHFANDLHDLISHLNMSKFVLISHSFGTLIAAEYIKLHGENVAVNIFLSPAFDSEKGLMAKIARPILKLSKIFSLFPFNPRPGHHVEYTKHPNTTDWDIKRFYADIPNTTLRVHLYCLRQLMLLEQEYFLEKIKIPTLIVHGMKDTMAKMENSITLSKKIKNSELALIPNTNHFFVLNNTKETSEILESFIEKNKKVLY